jgi:hypothetical protein
MLMPIFLLIVKQSGVSGLLDVARQTFKEATEDVHQHVTNINRKPIFYTSSSFGMLTDLFGRTIRDAS